MFRFSSHKTLFVLSALVLLIGGRNASANCHWNSAGTFYTCEGVGIRNGLGLSLPAVSDIIKVNPASLPTLPTPIGLEAMYSSRTDGPGAKKFDTSIIRGFQGIGFGLGTWNGFSISDANLDQIFKSGPYQLAYQDLQQKGSHHPGFQFGTSVAIPNPVPVLGQFSLGLSTGMTPTSTQLARNLGVSWVLRFLHAGYSYNVLSVASTLPHIKTATFNAGLQYDELSFDFSRVSVNADGPQPISSIYSLRWTDETWTVYGGARSYVSDLGQTRYWKSGSIHKRIGMSFELGYIYGRYMNSHSLSAQYYF